MLDIMGNLIGAGASVMGTLANVKSQMTMNKLNRDKESEINTQNLDFSKSMTQAQWERDDNAYQRAVADLESAGLSPLAMQGPANVSPAITDGPFESTMQYQAPQFDFNSLVQSLSSLSNNLVENKKLKLEYDKLGKEDEWHNDEIQTKLMEIDNEFQKILNDSEQIRINDKKVMADIKAINHSIELSINQFSEDVAHHQFLEKEDFDNNRFIRIYDTIKRLVPDGMRYKPCFSDTEYAEAWLTFQKEYRKNLQEVFGDVGSTFDPYSINKDPNVTTMMNNGSLGASVLGNGGNLGSGEYYSRDITQKQREEWNRRLSTMKFPIPFSESDKDLFDEHGILRSYSSSNRDFRSEYKWSE